MSSAPKYLASEVSGNLLYFIQADFRTLQTFYFLFICLDVTLQTIAGQAVMVQSYLVSDEDNKRLNNNSETIGWLLNLLQTATHARKNKEPRLAFDDVEIIQVQPASNHTNIVCPPIFTHMPLGNAFLSDTNPAFILGFV